MKFVGLRQCFPLFFEVGCTCSFWCCELVLGSGVRVVVEASSGGVGGSREARGFSLLSGRLI